MSFRCYKSKSISNGKHRLIESNIKHINRWFWSASDAMVPVTGEALLYVIRMIKKGTVRAKVVTTDLCKLYFRSSKKAKRRRARGGTD